MKNLVYFTLVLLLFGCSKSNESEGNDGSSNYSCIALDNAVAFSIQDKQGNDLLKLGNSKNKVYDFNRFKMFFMIDGKKVYMRDHVQHSGDGVILITDRTPYTVGCLTSVEPSDGIIIDDSDDMITYESYIYLELNDMDVDTIKTQWYRYKSTGTAGIIKEWYNGELHLHDNTKPFIVVK